MLPRPALLLLLLAGCPSAVPDHLRPPEAASEGGDARPLDDADDVIAAMVAADPLGRAPQGLDPDQVEAIDRAAPLAAVLRAAGDLGASADPALRRLVGLEAEHRGTAVVALSRGARLRAAESRLGEGTDRLGRAGESRILTLLTPLPPADPADDALPLRPLHWLPADALPATVLDHGDRWVLTGWLDGPAIDLQPVSEAMGAAPFDALRATPLGRLVLARAQGISGEVAGGLADLDEATRLALAAAAARTNREQEAVAARRQAVRERLAPPDDADETDPLGPVLPGTPERAAEREAVSPEHLLLQRAFERLVDAASDDRATGGALLAAHASRWYGPCEAGCVGLLDRTAGLSAAGRWHPDLARLVRLWQIARLDEGLDGLAVARDTIRYDEAVLDLVDALRGIGIVPASRVLRQRSPDASTWLALGRAAGAEQATTWPDALVALTGPLLTRIDEALAVESDPEIREDLQRLRRHAVTRADPTP